jgi:hypothetical protein
VRSFLFSASMLAVAACGAALLAHVGIDVAGDFLLAHDTYDGLEHRSRSEIFAVALAFASASVLWVLWVAFQDVRGGGGATRLSVEDLLGRGPWRFLAAVVALSLPLLIGMEFLDVTWSGGRVDDVTDLLGGSAQLGLSIASVTAVFVGLTVRHLARVLLASQRAFVAVVHRLIALVARVRPQGDARPPERGAGRRAGQRSILSRRFGKRGPPLSV